MPKFNPIERQKILADLRKKMADASKQQPKKPHMGRLGIRATGAFQLAEMEKARDISVSSKIPANKEIAKTLTKFFERGQRGEFEPTPELADAMIRVTKNLLRADAQHREIKLSPEEKRQFASLERY